MKRSRPVLLCALALALTVLPAAAAQPTPFKFVDDAEVFAEFGVGTGLPHDFDVRSTIKFTSPGSFMLNEHDLTITISEAGGADTIVLSFPEGADGWRPEGDRLKLDAQVSDQLGREFDFSFDVRLRSGGNLAAVTSGMRAELNMEGDTFSQLGFACAAAVTVTIDSGGVTATSEADSQCL